MIIKIKIENKIVELILKEKSKIMDKLSFPEYNNLSEKLLLSLDKLLKKNKLEPKDIRKDLAKVDTPESFTTVRIAKAVAKSFNWAIKGKNNF